jgi:uncharacterized repeat protein (TIGR01451 family)
MMLTGYSFAAFAASDLSVSIDGSPNPSTEGGSLQYVVRGSNAGPDQAGAVTATFTQPENTTLLTSSSAGAAGCGAANPSREIACDLGSIASGESADAVITVRPDVGTAGTMLASQASVADVLLDDPDNANNSTANNTAVRLPAGVDLGVSISDTPDPVEQGFNVSLTFVVTNNGGDDAQQSALSVSVSQGFFGSFTTSAGSCAAGANFDCAFGTINSGDVVNVTLEVITTASGTLTSTAEVSTVDNDTVAANNQAIENTTVAAPGDADLAISQTISPNPVTIGNSLTYELVGVNNGPAPASGVVVSDTLPSSVNYVSGAVTAGGTGCTYDDPSRLVTCGLGNLAVDGSATATLQLNAVVVGEQLNVASITGVQDDPNTENNSASQTHQIAEAGAVDLAVSVTDSPDPLTQGDTVTLTVVVSNSGPSESTLTMLDVTVSQGVISTISPASGSCTSGGTISCKLGTLAADAQTQVVIELVTISSSPNNLVTSAVVSSNETDSNADDNSAEETTVVAGVSQADLVLRITSLFEPVAISGRGSYPLTLSNRGPAAVAQPSAVVVIPEDTFFISGLNADGVESCTVPENGTTDCFYGNIFAGGEETINLVFSPDVALIGESYTISASITLANDADPDPSPESNSDSVTTQVVNFGVDVEDQHPRSGSVILESVNTGETEVVVAVFSVEALHHDTEFQSVTLAADGSGLDDADIRLVKLLLDANANGEVDVDEVIVASGQYAADQGILELTLDTPRTISRHGKENYLVLYDFSSGSVGLAVGKTNLALDRSASYSAGRLPPAADFSVNAGENSALVLSSLATFANQRNFVNRLVFSGSSTIISVIKVVAALWIVLFLLWLLAPYLKRLIIVFITAVALGCGGQAGEFIQAEGGNISSYRVFIVDMKAADSSSGFLFFVDGLPFVGPGFGIANDGPS